MADPYELVYAPRISANDEAVTIVAWAKADGATVEAGEALCELESSKSTVEVTAPRAGWLFHLHRAGDEVAVAKPLLVITSTPHRPELRPEGSSGLGSGVKITAKARLLIESHAIPPAVFQGLEIVKEQHVLDYLAKQGGSEDESVPEGELLPLSPIRRRIARTVATSKQTIPHSYLQRWVDADAVQARIDQVGGQLGLMVSVFDLLVEAVASAAATHPKLNAAWHDDGLLQYAGVHVGFALNLASGELLVPVVRDAGGLPFEDLVGRIRGLQKSAIRNKLAPESLSGGTITVTSLVGTGVHQVFPIIVPGQAAIVAVADPYGPPGARAYTLTLAFDHRIANGVEAAEFLAAVSGTLEGSPQNG